jgi:tetratricopeptide (TPR) repeat protein
MSTRVFNLEHLFNLKSSGAKHAHWRALALATALALSVGFSACSTQPINKPAGSAPENARSASSSASSNNVRLPIVLGLPGYPLTVAQRQTSDGQRFIDNLNGRLAASKATSPPDAHRDAVRAGVLYQRYQILGALADLDAAYSLIERVVAAPEADNDALLLGATISAHLHLFDAASSLLDRMPPSEPAAALRVEIAEARSMPPIALTAPGAELSTGKEYAQLVQLAFHSLERGDLDRASAYFHGAQFAYTDVSPLPLAWLHTQQGIALQRFDYPAEAIPFFRAAIARLPNYALAMEHLADSLGRVGEFAEGRALFQATLAQTDNPAAMAGLASLEVRAGNLNAAAEWGAKAERRYDALLAQHPDAYSQHAVSFFISLRDIKRAGALAQHNLTLRQDALAYVLAAQVQVLEGDLARACTTLQPIIDAGRKPPELLALRERLPDCAVLR